MNLDVAEMWLEDAARLEDEINKCKPPSMKIARRLVLAFNSIGEAVAALEQAVSILKNEPTKE